MDAANTAAWSAPAAWGAALIQLALGAGSLSAGALTAGAFTGAPLVILGTAGIAWGAVTLARGRLVAPRAGVAGALAGIVSGAAALAADPARTSIVAVAAASALLVVVGLACAGTLRRRPGRRATHRPTTRLAPLIASAVVVAAIATPALAATEAGRIAPDHSTHGTVVDEHRH